MAAFSPAFCDVLRCRTKIIDEHSSHHGSAAAAQAKVEALQDSLRRRPQGGGHGGAQEGDTRGPNWGMGHTWRDTQGQGTVRRLNIKRQTLTKI